MAKIAPAVPEVLELLDDELELVDEELELLEDEFELFDEELELLDELELEEDELDELVGSVLDPPQAVIANRRLAIRIFFIVSPAE